jgi:bifunctional DNase/RNase
MIPVRVHGVGMSPYNQGFVALLMDDTYNQWLPIYIGSFEAQAIAMELDDVDPPRPMTHDLMATMVQELDAEIDHIVVTELKDSTYYADIVLEADGEELVIDARPSDSIALGLRLDADIYVEEDVMEEASIPAKPEEAESEGAKKLKILQHRLQRAVESEDFEEAADIRDQIRELQKELRHQEESEEIDADVEAELEEELGEEELDADLDFAEDFDDVDFEAEQEPEESDDDEDDDEDEES